MLFVSFLAWLVIQLILLWEYVFSGSILGLSDAEHLCRPEGLELYLKQSLKPFQCKLLCLLVNATSVLVMETRPHQPSSVSFLLLIRKN